MDLIKKVQQLFLGLVVLLAFGCGKDDDGGTPEPEPTYTSCRLIKLTADNGNLIREFIYNNQHQVVRENVSRNGNVSYYIPEYNAYGKIAKRWHIIGTDTIETLIFEYNTDSLLVKRTQFGKYMQTDSLAPKIFEKYMYNAAKQLINFTWSNAQNGQIYNEYKYFYLINNTTRIESYAPNKVTQVMELESVSESTYDSNKKPGGNVAYFQDAKISKHNRLTEIHTSYQNGNAINTTNTSASYTYNSADYPLTSTFNNGSGAPLIETYTYTCQ